MKISVFSDVHANSVAFSKMIAHAEENGFDNHYLFLGDLLGYGPFPNETLDLFKQILPKTDFILGNHDELLTKLVRLSGYNLDQLKEVFPGTSPRSLLTLRNNINEIVLNNGNNTWYFDILAEFGKEKSKLLKFDNLSVTISHGMWEVRDLYLYPSSSDEIIEKYHIFPLKELEKVPLISFVGHTHIPWFFSVKSGWKERNQSAIDYGKELCLKESFYVINPGSVGNPRDGDTRLSYLVLDTEESTVTFHRLTYDKDTVIQALVNKNFDMKTLKYLDEATIPNQDITQANMAEMKRRMNN